MTPPPMPLLALAVIFACGLQPLFADEVPPVLQGGFESFRTPLPDSAEAWEKQKPQLRATLRELLGDWPPLFTPEPRIVSSERRDGYTLEKFTFDNGIGDTVYGYVLLPDDRTQPGPAVLYHHQHGGLYDRGKEEVLNETYEPLEFATGEQLARAGYVVLAIDAYAFGERQFQGPAGEEEQGSQTQESLFKAFVWEGRTLWGMMVRDDQLALNYLLSRPEVDPDRVAAMGMSIGATRTWWAAAMDDRIKGAISVACLTRYQNLIAEGNVRYHGIYYFVPNMLKEGIDAESVVGLIAPRPHLTLTGDRDHGSPAAGVKIINDFQRRLYDLYDEPDHFQGVLYEGVGHSFTPAMWDQAMRWLETHL